MKLDRSRHGAEAQQAQQAQQASHAHEGGRSRSGHHGYAGGMHKGVAYRHAPRPHLPTRRNTGPAAKARSRPASSAPTAAHQGDEHAHMPTEDPFALQNAGAGISTDGDAGGGAARRRTAGLGGQVDTAGHESRQPQAPDPFAAARHQPPVQEGAALRRSRLPAAALLNKTPGASPMTPAVLLEAYTSLYFKSSGDGPAGAMRLAAKAALARHLAPDASPMTLAEIRAAAVSWCQAHGRPPAATQAQRDANLLYPLHALRAMAGSLPSQDGRSQACNALLQRALASAVPKEPHA